MTLFAGRLITKTNCNNYEKLWSPCSFHGVTAPSGPGPTHNRSFMITLRHTTLARTPLDEWSARRRDACVWCHLAVTRLQWNYIRTQYTKCCLLRASWGWASNARNMQRPWFSTNWMKSASRWFHYTDETRTFIFQVAGKIYRVTRTHRLFRLDPLETATRTTHCFSCGLSSAPARLS
jgi:hypothetical protein